VSNALAAQGLAVVSYDGVLHGPRDPTHSNPDTTFFNLFNIVAGRDNVRQGGVDVVVLTKLLSSGYELPAEVTQEGAARFDKDRIGYLGHSQGGLVGAPYVASEPTLKAAVFSGTSGVLTITLLKRKVPLDFSGLLTTLLSLPASETLDELHPVLSLLQTFIEPADPINYGASYLADPAGAPLGHATDTLFIEGFLDFDSPPLGHEALASAAHAPSVAPTYRVPYVASLLGPAPEAAPASANATTPAGPATIGLIQYPHDTHFPIFDNLDATTRYVEFLRSALVDGRARIITGQPQQ
jgi:hypothetical protein